MAPKLGGGMGPGTPKACGACSPGWPGVGQVVFFQDRDSPPKKEKNNTHKKTILPHAVPITLGPIPMDPERFFAPDWRPQTSNRSIVVHFRPYLVFRSVPDWFRWVPDTDILRPCMVGLVVRYPDSAIQAAKSCCLLRYVLIADQKNQSNQRNLG